MVQEKLASNYAELSGAFKNSLEGLARTVQDLHNIIKWVASQTAAWAWGTITPQAAAA